jgi:uncharacterized protein
MWERQVGWGAVITTLLFGLVHGLWLRSGLSVAFDPGAIVLACLSGGLLLWVRVRSDSLLPAVLLHNGLNVSVVVAAAVSG